MRLGFTIPIQLVSEANTREHWAKKARRARAQRAAALMAVRAHANGRKLTAPFVVTLTRISPRGLDDDNLARAFKAVRDGVAEALNVDDGDERRIRWAYRQERGIAKQHAVMVQIY